MASKRDDISELELGNQPLGGEPNEGLFSSTPWFGLLMPLLIAAAILLFSPNFKSIEGVRSGSLGGDFLQEWVGGYIANSEEPDRIYDLDHFKAIQHDPEIVGFQWPEKSYFPAVYPPFFYQMMRPFSVLPYPIASKIWLLISALAVSISGWLLWRFYLPARKLVLIGLFALIVFVPLITCLVTGQKAAFLLLVLTGTFLLLHHEQPLSAGLVFGLIAFKPHLGLVIGIAMLLKRQWAFAAGAITTVALMVGVSWWISPKLWTDYFEVVMGMNNYVESGGYQLTDSHSLWGAVQLGLASFEPPSWLVKAITGLSMVAVVWLLVRIMRGPIKTNSGTFASQFAGLVIAMVMLSPHFYSYDLTILLLPMVLLGSAALGALKNQPFSPMNWMLIGMFMLAGLFQPLAKSAGFQFSTILFFAALILIPSFQLQLKKQVQ